MPLFKEVDGKFIQWMGEPINDIPYPLNIEEKWSYKSLVSIGLFRPQEPEQVPDGYRVLSTDIKRASDGYVRYVHTLEEVEPLPLDSRVVDIEATRRIQLGFTYEGKEFDNDVQSSRRISGAGTLATAALLLGAQPGNLYWHAPSEVWEMSQEDKDEMGILPFGWITKDNSIIYLDAPLTVGLGRVAAEWEQAHVFAARAIKDMEVIPTDFEDDIYWP